MRIPVRQLFAERLGLYPFNEVKMPNNPSTLYFYLVGLRVVIVQEFSGGDNGWCEYIGTDHNDSERSLADLKQLKEEK